MHVHVGRYKFSPYMCSTLVENFLRIALARCIIIAIGEKENFCLQSSQLARTKCLERSRFSVGKILNRPGINGILK